MNSEYIHDKMIEDWKYNLPRYEFIRSFLEECYKTGFKIVHIRNKTFHSRWFVKPFLLNPRWRELQVFIAGK